MDTAKSRYRRNCQFCRIGRGDRSVPEYDWPITESEHFVVIVSMGPFSKAYVLICPREHYFSLGQLGEGSLWDEFNRLKRRVRDAFIEEFGVRPTFFEHGATSLFDSSGACVDHAHLHCLALQIDGIPQAIESRMKAEGNVVPATGITGCAKLQKPYFYFEDSRQTRYAFGGVDLPCQFGRRVLAGLTENPEQWNWREHPKKNEMMKIIRLLKPHFGRTAKTRLFFGQPVDFTDQSKVVANLSCLRGAVADLCVDLEVPYLDAYECKDVSDIQCLTRQEAQRIVEKDREAIRRSDIVVLDLSNETRQAVGMLFEFAHAEALGKKIIVYAGRSSVGHRLWVKALADRVCQSWADVGNALREFGVPQQPRGRRVNRISARSQDP
jgi:diadenosine tetraphosphate (Ap4A) HIT family hydrolase